MDTQLRGEQNATVDALTAGDGGHGTQRQTDSVTNEELEVVKAAERRARALAENDAAELELLHHPRLRWTTHRGEVLDRGRYIEGNTRGGLRWKSQRLEDVEVGIFESCAVLTAVVIDDVERGGAAETFRLRMTQVWTQMDGRWLCVAGHAGPRIGEARK